MPAPRKKPVHPKVKAAGQGGGITAALVTAIAAIFHIGLAQPVAVLVAAVLTAIGAFVGGYMKKVR